MIGTLGVRFVEPIFVDCFLFKQRLHSQDTLSDGFALHPSPRRCTDTRYRSRCAHAVHKSRVDVDGNAQQLSTTCVGNPFPGLGIAPARSTVVTPVFCQSGAQCFQGCSPLGGTNPSTCWSLYPINGRSAITFSIISYSSHTCPKM